MNKIYAGIGGRNTPPDVCKEFTSIALQLAYKGYQLRSGGADGADSAFEIGSGYSSGKPILMEIWLPWKGFNNNNSHYILESPILEPVVEIASKIYDRWDISTDAVKKLHARNVYQILGHDLNTPVDFVICWTDRPDSDTGGTQFGMHLATEWKIPVYNFNNSDEKQLFYYDMNNL